MEKQLGIGIVVAFAALADGASGQCVALEEARLVAPDGAGGDRFGAAVATAGARVVVGAPEDDLEAVNDGTVRLFVETGPGWSAEQLLRSPAGQSGDRLGVAVDLDGDRVIAGATGYDLYATNGGAAVLWTRSGDQWAFERVLGVAGTIGSGDRLGAAVALWDDSALVGAPQHDFDFAANGGAAYVFTRGDGSWPLEVELRPATSQDGALFGLGLDLVDDLAVVGAPAEDHGGLTDAGAVYVFFRGGGSWQQLARLAAGDAADGDGFGAAVALAGDTILIGAPGSDATAPESGAVYVFERSGGTWVETQRLVNVEAAPEGALGSSVALRGGLALVGGASASTGAGRALLFEREGGAFEHAWTLTGSQVEPGELFGAAVALSAQRAVVGAPRDQGGAGAAYVHELACDAVGVGYCSGDGSGTPCPCGNAGAAGRGCANGSSPAGAMLVATGSAQVDGDTVVLAAQGLPPGQPGLFFQGENALNGGAGLVFGDGLRCAGGDARRLEVVTADDSGAAASSVLLAQAGGVAPGDTRRYQIWYRDPLGSPCGTGFNLSNGLAIGWR